MFVNVLFSTAVGFFAVGGVDQMCLMPLKIRLSGNFINFFKKNEISS